MRAQGGRSYLLSLVVAALMVSGAFPCVHYLYFAETGRQCKQWLDTVKQWLNAVVSHPMLSWRLVRQSTEQISIEITNATTVATIGAHAWSDDPAHLRGIGEHVALVFIEGSGAHQAILAPLVVNGAVVIRVPLIK